MGERRLSAPSPATRAFEIFSKVAVCCAAASPGLVLPREAAGASSPQAAARRTTPEDFEVEVHRYELENGLVVLLAPDPTAASVFVAAAHRAGALMEPPKKTGLAHLVEHLLITGTATDTYGHAARSRGALHFNAFTGPTFMRFELELPPEELPFALWLTADRLAGRIERVTPELFERERAIIRVERALRALDRPFAVADQAILDHLFPSSHAFHGGVLGKPDDLARVTLDDARAFARAWVHPGTGVLLIAGALDLATARRLVEDTVARVPPGPTPRRARARARRTREAELAAREAWSRRPRVSLVWKLPPLDTTTRETLTLGAALVAGFVDGAFGARVRAGVLDLESDAVFRMDVILPHDKPIEAARGEAEVFLRYLTAVDMPTDFYNTVRILRDLRRLRAVDGIASRARMLLEVELRGDDPTRLARVLGRQWVLQRHDVQHTAWKKLITGAPRLTVHARPTRPLAPKLDWRTREAAK
jgi:hypothetical protein